MASAERRFRSCLNRPPGLMAPADRLRQGRPRCPGRCSRGQHVRHRRALDGPGPAGQPRLDPDRGLGRPDRDRHGRARRQLPGAPHDAVDRLPGGVRGGPADLPGRRRDRSPLPCAGTCGPAWRSARSASPCRSRRRLPLPRFVLGWSLQASEIAGLALSTTSVAVVYAVMIESGLAAQEIGKLILAACFVTDLGTVLFLGLLFANVSPLLIVFAAATAVAMVLVPKLLRSFMARLSGRVSEPRSSSCSWSCWRSAASPSLPERGGPAGLSHRAGGRRGLRRRPGPRPPDAGDGLLAADPVLLPEGRLARVAPGDRRRRRPDRAVSRREGRRQGHRRVAHRSRLRAADPRCQLHDAADVHRPDLRDDRGPVSA